MKKLIKVCLFVLVILMLAACSGGGSGNNNGGTGGAKKIAQELAGFIARYDQLDAAKFVDFAR